MFQPIYDTFASEEHLGDTEEVLKLICPSCGVKPTQWDFFESRSLYQRMLCHGCRQKFMPQEEGAANE